MMTEKKDAFLVLDDDEDRLNAYEKRLAGFRAMGHRVLITPSFDLALEEASRSRFEVMFLDHDLGELTDLNRVPSMYGASNRSWTGEDFVRCLLKLHKSLWPEEAIIHSHNPDGAKRMHARFIEVGVWAVLRPFSA